MTGSVQKNVRSQRRAAHLFLRYMNAKAPELRPLVAKWAEDPDEVDPCGPSPILIHLPQLRKLTPEWLALSFKLKRDEEADKVFGWVLEMWGYTIAASRLVMCDSSVGRMSPPPSLTLTLHCAQVPPPPQAEETNRLLSARAVSSFEPMGT